MDPLIISIKIIIGKMRAKKKNFRKYLVQDFKILVKKKTFFVVSKNYFRSLSSKKSNETLKQKQQNKFLAYF